MTTVTRIGHGTRCFVATTAPATETVAGYNGGNFIVNNNAGRYMEASSPLNSTLSTGGQKAVSTAEPTDRNLVLKQLVDIRNPGVLTLTFLKDDDDAGQAALRTAFAARAPITIKLLHAASRNGGISQASHHAAADEAIYFRGLVSGYNGYNAGAGGDWLNTEVTVELIVDPVSNVA